MANENGSTPDGNFAREAGDAVLFEGCGNEY